MFLSLVVAGVRDLMPRVIQTAVCALFDFSLLVWPPMSPTVQAVLEASIWAHSACSCHLTAEKRAGLAVEAAGNIVLVKDWVDEGRGGHGGAHAVRSAGPLEGGQLPAEAARARDGHRRRSAAEQRTPL